MILATCIYLFFSSTYITTKTQKHQPSRQKNKEKRPKYWILESRLQKTSLATSTQHHCTNNQQCKRIHKKRENTTTKNSCTTKQEGTHRPKPAKTSHRAINKTKTSHSVKETSHRTTKKIKINLDPIFARKIVKEGWQEAHNGGRTLCRQLLATQQGTELNFPGIHGKPSLIILDVTNKISCTMGLIDIRIADYGCRPL